MINDEDWYDAIVIDNSLLGGSFPLGKQCVFRFHSKKEDKKIFEVFNIKDTVKILSGEEAKTQLRSVRSKRTNEVLRSSDQGFINWKYQSL
jgi:hypothetical protein